MAAANAARDGQTALALRLVKHLAPPPAAADATGNTVFSPVSVHAALALVAAGARGATQAQLLAFLGAHSAAELADFGRGVADRVLADRSDSGGPRVLFGGGAWIDASRGELADAFHNVATKTYKCEARLVNFTEEPEEAVKMINEWVKKATNGLIETMISTSDIDAETDLVLANAVYFKGKWLEPFHPCNNRTRAFHCLNGSRVKTETMWMREELHVACMDGFKFLKLPYKTGRKAEATGAGRHKRRRGGSTSDMPDVDGKMQYSMFIFLPDKHDGVANMVDMVTAAPAFMYDILAEMKELPVELELPKFKITFNWGKLKGALRQLGLSLPFSREVADLRGMYKEDDSDGKLGQRMFLSKVAHMAVVEVNELGTEAAATTWSMRGGGGPPPGMVKFVADHPFTFFIMEEKSGVIVFAGDVLDPSK
ncbi:hypothetical protein PR202_gb13108 [Eleusine coracana subsp. coracana]|uniref:Serpin domain-containing protein n=1 Tax=Eleusine coracana subsp. coracana TaxID=191504 RepID=A0AAV5EPK1_ELECO|nr:hypothetical protein QOZ80_9BG0710530 [Eleusine coracana subsp. coracana]GJN25299.1 hypothetical protein PR202_gb13108 [Eleusine coracana subsp. coracana]